MPGSQQALPEDLPFNLLVIGETQAQTFRAPVTIAESDDMAAAMARLGDCVFPDAPNLLAHHGKPIQNRVTLQDFDVFTPAGLAAAIPTLARGLALRDALEEALREGGEVEAALADFADLTALTEAARTALPGGSASVPDDAGPSGPPGTEDDLDRLISQVDTPEHAEETPGARLVRSFIAQRRGKRQAGGERVAGPVAAVNALLAAQAAAILRTPAFRAAENFWLGLRWLGSQVDFRAGDRLTVIRAPRERMPDLIERIDPGEVPWSAILVDVQIDASSRDMTWLNTLAEAAENAQAPAILGVAPDFFGHEVLPAELPYLGTLLDSSAYDGWHAFRSKPHSRWTALAANRFLLRTPFDDSRRKSLGLNEPDVPQAELSWGNPAWLVAGALAGSAARHRWPTEITGQVDSAPSGLPVAPWDPEDPESPRIPLETLLDAQACRDVAEAGMIPVTCRRNRDTAFLASAPVAHRPEVYADAAMTEASRRMATLPYQLAGARLLNYLAALKSLAGDLPATTMARAIERALAYYLDGTGPGAAVTARIEDTGDGPAQEALAIDIKLGRRIAEGARYTFSLAV